MHFISLTSIFLPVVTFTVLAHAAALKVDTVATTSRGTGISLSSMTNTQLKARQNPAFIQAGPFPTEDYASSVVANFTFQQYFKTEYYPSGTLADTEAAVAISIATGFYDALNVSMGVTQSEYVVWNALPVNVDLAAAGDIKVTIGMIVSNDEIELYKEWASGISSASAATSAGQLLAAQMGSANQVLACFNSWVGGMGWLKYPGFAYIYNEVNTIPENHLTLMPVLTEDDMSAILANC